MDLGFDLGESTAQQPLPQAHRLTLFRPKSGLEGPQLHHASPGQERADGLADLIGLGLLQDPFGWELQQPRTLVGGITGQKQQQWGRLPALPQLLQLPLQCGCGHSCRDTPDDQLNAAFKRVGPGRQPMLSLQQSD